MTASEWLASVHANQELYNKMELVVTADAQSQSCNIMLHSGYVAYGLLRIAEAIERLADVEERRMGWKTEQPAAPPTPSVGTEEPK